MNIDTLNLSELLEYALSDEQELYYYDRVCALLRHEGLGEHIVDAKSHGEGILNATRHIIGQANIDAIKNGLEYQSAKSMTERAKLMLAGHSTLIGKLLAIRVEMCKDMPELERLFVKKISEK